MLDVPPVDEQGDRMAEPPGQARGVGRGARGIVEREGIPLPAKASRERNIGSGAPAQERFEPAKIQQIAVREQRRRGGRHGAVGGVYEHAWLQGRRKRVRVWRISAVCRESSFTKALNTLSSCISSIDDR